VRLDLLVCRNGMMNGMPKGRMVMQKSSVDR
jgi:hypothetical protein